MLIQTNKYVAIKWLLKASCCTRRSVPCSSTSREVSSCSRWEHIWRLTDTMQRVRNLGTHSPKRMPPSTPPQFSGNPVQKLEPEEMETASRQRSLLNHQERWCSLRQHAQGLHGAAEDGVLNLKEVDTLTLKPFPADKCLQMENQFSPRKSILGAK